MASSSSSSSPEISHAPPVFDSSFFKYASLDDVLEELSTRFIMNLPDQEMASVERMCFQVEQAHWYYEDFMREANPKLPTLTLKKFSSIFFNASPLLRQWSPDHEVLFNTFMHYKVRVPVCGAIMLNEKWDKCLLVKGWKSSAGWGFPKGKINQREALHCCAIREVQEETGFNLEKYIRPEDFIETTIREQSVTLFVVGGIPEKFPFQTRTRKEISKIEWFKLSDLPMWKRNKQVAGKFYLIYPFIPPLKEFVRVNKPNKRRQNRRKSGTDTSADLTIQTDFDPDESVRAESPLENQGTTCRAVSLERDAHASSSSSADNGDPQTPSPQSTEAFPVTVPLVVDSEPEQSMDPHFARLLSGLSSSAKKPLSNEQIESRPMSITPISGKSNSANPAVENMLGHSRDLNSPAKLAFTDRSSPSKESMHMQSPSTSSANSSFSSSRSNSSSVTVMAKSPKSSTFEPSIPPLSVDRHLKHLALLESVAQESVVSSSIPVSRSTVHPGLTSSVPPSFLPESRSIPPSGLFPSGPVHPLTAVGHTDPSVDDPFTVRPRTSQAVFPPSPPAVRRHGPNLSMHQGSLLSILSGPNGVSTHGPPSFSAPHPNSIFTRPAATPLINGNIPPPSFQHQAQSFVPQPPRVMPPPPGAFQLNPQPFPVPLVPTGQPSFPGSVTTPGLNNPHAPNRAHLLSLLNPNTMAGPTSILHADATRPNYPTGSPATATSMRPSFGVSNGIVHR